MDAEKMAMQKRIDTLDQYATRLHAALTEAERENARLKAELETVKRERDAAVHDLNMSASCAVCIKGTDEDYICNDCMDCDGSIGFVWRGLCKENGGIEG